VPALPSRPTPRIDIAAESRQYKIINAGALIAFEKVAAGRGDI
jgi:hypothetical protein